MTKAQRIEIIIALLALIIAFLAWQYPKSPQTLNPTSTSLLLDKTPTLRSDNYLCDDLDNIKLKLGDSAKVMIQDVRLRSSPNVPTDYSSNVITTLKEGNILTIIDGPFCAHKGTWWQVKTKLGFIGLIREFVSGDYQISKQ